LRVAEVAPLTDDAVAVTLEVPETLVDAFRYLPGQHVTLRAMIDGHDVRRSYSICANANSARLRVGIKRLGGGAFSTWAVGELQAGDVLEAMPPVGEFTITPDPEASHHYAAIAAGSGITPVLSLVSTTLESEPASRWTVILGNRSARTVMFLDELQGLKDRYPDRLHLVHVLSQEMPEVPLFAGRIDHDKLKRLFATVADTSTVDEWFLCGPFEMVGVARDLLEERGVEPKKIHDELFFAGPLDVQSLPTEPPPGDGAVAVEFTLAGRRSEVRMRSEEKILDAALRVRRELPFSCKGGMCASCKARLIEGKVEMEKNYALVNTDLDQGLVLTCQSHPLTDRIVLDYDV
jgi:ring-1,2-phenylacetyl-CoA epoxidase subunit PaaE